MVLEFYAIGLLFEVVFVAIFNGGGHGSVHLLWGTGECSPYFCWQRIWLNFLSVFHQW